MPNHHGKIRLSDQGYRRQQTDQGGKGKVLLMRDGHSERSVVGRD